MALLHTVFLCFVHLYSHYGPILFLNLSLFFYNVVNIHIHLQCSPAANTITCLVKQLHSLYILYICSLCSNVFVYIIIVTDNSHLSEVLQCLCKDQHLTAIT